MNEGCHCSLCGNCGIIDTRETAITGSNVKTGRLNYCICPNGRIMRESASPNYSLDDALRVHRLNTQVQQTLQRLVDFES